MESTSKYRAVIFDLDGTLYDYGQNHGAAMERLRAFACGKFGITRNGFDEAFAWAKNQTKLLLGNTGASHNRMLYCQKALERLGRNPVDGALEMYDCYWGSMLSGMKLRDGTLALLERLKRGGIKIAVCTDLTAHIQHRKIRALGLVPYIDVLVTSEEAGAEKPSGRMYALVLQKLGMKAGECLFVGDNRKKDVDAPKGYGMDAMPFTTMEKLAEYIYGK